MLLRHSKQPTRQASVPSPSSVSLPRQIKGHVKYFDRSHAPQNDIAASIDVASQKQKHSSQKVQRYFSKSQSVRQSTMPNIAIVIEVFWHCQKALLPPNLVEVFQVSLRRRHHHWHLSKIYRTNLSLAFSRLA